MDRRFESRFDEMMDQAKVTPELLRDLPPRLTLFLEPFLPSLSGPEKKQRALEYTTGLISGLEHKTGEGIAYLYDQDRQGISAWVSRPPRSRAANASASSWPANCTSVAAFR
jgi:hypothetical protein